MATITLQSASKTGSGLNMSVISTLSSGASCTFQIVGYDALDNKLGGFPYPYPVGVPGGEVYGSTVLPTSCTFPVPCNAGFSLQSVVKVRVRVFPPGGAAADDKTFPV